MSVGRERRGERLARFGQHTRRYFPAPNRLVSAAKASGGWLNQIEQARISASCSGLLQPRRLPRHAGDQIGLRREVFPASAPANCSRFFRINRPHGDDEFPGVGEMFLVNFQPLHGRLFRRQQIQNLHIEAQPLRAAAIATSSGTHHQRFSSALMAKEILR